MRAGRDIGKETQEREGGRDRSDQKERGQRPRERGGREKAREGENEKEGGRKGALESFRKQKRKRTTRRDTDGNEDRKIGERKL